jgi:hypothetical protein
MVTAFEAKRRSADPCANEFRVGRYSVCAFGGDLERIASKAR